MHKLIRSGILAQGVEVKPATAKLVRAAARYAPHTAGVVTFQGANIAQADVDKVAAYNRAHPNQQIASRNYRVDGDTVPTSGEASLPGSIH